jgi:alkanesulfonate monooxygenase SsuD/methylene tetrahydromethanopterin reductase-like flavin-dependent oxidoreductase (luciferase family)
MHIGVVLPQTGADWPEVLEAAQHAESIGADSIWVVDHLLGFPPDRGILEAWTLLSALASATERVELGAQVFCQSFRSPSLFAKMTATLDRVSNGRVRMLIGAGWHEPEYDAFGYEFPAAGVRVEELVDQIRILKGMLSGPEPFTYEGKHFHVKDVVNVPTPHRSPFPIEVGAFGDRMMRIIAREADGWNCPAVALGELDDRLAFLEKACADNGRSIADLRLTCQIACAVGDDEAKAKAPVAMFSPDLGFVGSVQQAVDRAGELMGKGIEGFHVIVPRGERGRACLERLVNEVRPKLAQ